jgi:transposase-like protein
MAMPCSTHNPRFLGRWFQQVIIVAVRWYLTYPLSYRQVATCCAIGGCRWLRDRHGVLRYAPEFEKRGQGYEKPVALSGRVDETYLKVGGGWRYL